MGFLAICESFVNSCSFLMSISISIDFVVWEPNRLEAIINQREVIIGKILSIHFIHLYKPSKCDDTWLTLKIFVDQSFTFINVNWLTLFVKWNRSALWLFKPIESTLYVRLPSSSCCCCCKRFVVFLTSLYFDFEISFFWIVICDCHQIIALLILFVFFSHFKWLKIFVHEIQRHRMRSMTYLNRMLNESFCWSHQFQCYISHLWTNLFTFFHYIWRKHIFVYLLHIIRSSTQIVCIYFDKLIL